jgi:hypothetical protein
MASSMTFSGRALHLAYVKHHSQLVMNDWLLLKKRCTL